MTRFLRRQRGGAGELAWESLVVSVPCVTCGDMVWVHPSQRDTSPLHPNPGGQW
jgi:hypothetical protein